MARSKTPDGNRPGDCRPSDRPERTLYTDLTRYAGHLAVNPGEWEPRHQNAKGTMDASIIMPYFVYGPALQGFVDAFFETSDFADLRYLDTLEERGIEASHLGFASVDVGHADLELIRAHITTAVRQDRFREGLLGTLAGNGSLDRRPLRLKELDRR